MKLWEAIEKSNKVRRTGWPDGMHIKESTIKEDCKIEEIRPCYFGHDDWEPYKELEAVPEPETDKEGKSETQKIRETGSTMKNLGDFFCLVCDVMEKQQKQIDELKLIAHDHGVHGIERP